jgi:hypothetical protein
MILTDQTSGKDQKRDVDVQVYVLKNVLSSWVYNSCRREYLVLPVSIFTVGGYKRWRGLRAYTGKIVLYKSYKIQLQILYKKC